MPAVSDSVLAARTARFVSNASAIAMASLMDATSAKHLVARAKSVRLFCASGDLVLACKALDQVEALMAEDGLEVDRDVAESVAHHVKIIRSSIR